MPKRIDHHTTLIVALMAASLAGCAPEMAGLRQSFAHPGPAAYQRPQAIHHDPYVLNDLGPEVVGGRPREYQIPVNEVERARMAATPPIGLTPVAGPPVVTTPAPGAHPYAAAPVPAAPPYPPTGAPIVTTPTPVASPFPPQQRPPY